MMNVFTAFMVMIGFFTTFVVTSANAQTFPTLKVGPSTPLNASAVLEIQSTTGALLLPRMTTTQKNAITATAGDMVYDSTLGTFSVYQGGVWTSLSTGGGAIWGSITGTLSAQTDLQTALNLKAPLASPTFTGTVTAPTFVGALTGNASTSTALASVPTGCSSNQFSTSIAANGNLGCTAVNYNQLAGVLPNPSASSLGGIQSFAAQSNKWINTISTLGVPSATQPNYTDLAGVLPNPSASTLGGIQSAAAQSHKWINSISTSGVPSLTQPNFSDLTGNGTVAQGGTGLTALTSHNVLIGNGTGNVTLIAPGTLGFALISNGASSDPSYQAISPTFAGLTTNAPMIANSTTTITSIASAGTAGQILFSNGSGSPPAYASMKVATRQIFKPEGITTTGALTSGNACIATPANINGINVGAGITDTTTPANITNGTYVLGIGLSPCSAGQIKMSVNAAGSGGTDTLVFGANKSTTATVTSASACLSTVTSTAGVAPGAYIYDVTTPSGKVAVNAVVVAVPGSCSAGQIQMSAVALATDTGATIAFSGGQYTLPSPAPLYLRSIGAGGGGTGCTGSAGQPTYFGSVTMLAATGGKDQGAGNVGGIASSTLTNSPLLLSGGTGSDGFPLFASGAASGAIGGSNPFGGAGGGGPGGGGTGASGAANTGAGGGSNGVGVGGTSGNGGGAGGYFNGIITSPSPTYLVFPGSGGTGSGCGNGGTGVVIVEEYYQ